MLFVGLFILWIDKNDAEIGHVSSGPEKINRAEIWTEVLLDHFLINWLV